MIVPDSSFSHIYCLHIESNKAVKFCPSLHSFWVVPQLDSRDINPGCLRMILVADLCSIRSGLSAIKYHTFSFSCGAQKWWAIIKNRDFKKWKFSFLRQKKACRRWVLHFLSVPIGDWSFCQNSSTSDYFLRKKTEFSFFEIPIFRKGRNDALDHKRMNKSAGKCFLDRITISKASSVLL